MKTLKTNTRVIIPAITFVLGLVWVIYGLTNYGWWDEGPGSGFFPSIIGILTSGVSIIAFLEGKKMAPPEYIKASYLPFIAAFVTVGSAMIIGFFPAMFLFLQGWLKLIEKYSWKKSLPISVITTAILYGVFAMWLMVPFPEGLIFNAIRG
ncbi:MULTISPECIES: tripartite tricarboxylate transporter TctB family protein [unclassified Oceanispirochaeta]|uniref:tripartite tricarboxylate transporter TctB family protein n=1 Tax=unclassified Oceanispirochaeta TaxID=2635722 RepID=UPI000E08D7CC|nr:MULTISPECIES: tripartite tricarboxylate transporter TctB family protein [unclassified Oceanispirochaeta]MBF9018371.1 tripartite tricarboxylate transporter TctB family protein [Oceanispirochaeta sp. M2]NPD74825.1 tripartite tricarboxylate transporter TctB family protein [Oceanispirochaeta sp. M1]RDG29318.1 tripartite tricarboxylate transporter TctB family protein [Oceanispirochaeta sp. M1]